MLATFVIGLREGLEAALIVGIIAAFLKRRGSSLRPMWLGVVLAIVLSILVGVLLEVVQQALPQREQEGMETIIGAVAIVFVSGMVLWMRDHARNLKGDIEGQAEDALASGTARAMAIMAFLAVLKEGFESAVFLLATFQASTSVVSAALGAVLGILVAVGIGYGIYTGGVRINLGKFFQITGPFLVLVAAGLVVSALRTAHEAGWIVIGQQRTLDLSWLAPNGTVRAALITGVLGVPADPRLVEVIGWLLYLVPMMLIVLWPAKKRLRGVAQIRALFAGAAALAVTACVLALAVPLPTVPSPSNQAVASDGSTLDFAQKSTGGATLTVTSEQGAKTTYDFAAPDKQDSHPGSPVTWKTTVDKKSEAPGQLTLTQLAQLNGGRLPVGINVDRQPGPFTATQEHTDEATVVVFDGGIVNASTSGSGIATLRGGGLTAPRTVSYTGASVSVDEATATALEQQISQTQQDRAERLLWKMWLPIVAAIAALGLSLQALQLRRKNHHPTPPGGPAQSKEKL